MVLKILSQIVFPRLCIAFFGIEGVEAFAIED